MESIIQSTTLLGSIYTIRNDSQSQIIKAGALGITKKSSFKKKDYFIIFNLNGEILYECTDYLNQQLLSHNFKTREQYFSALKILYSFLELFDYKFDNQTFSNLRVMNQLITFLEGGNQVYSHYKLKLKSRQRNTVLLYLEIFKTYFSFLHPCKVNPFNSKRINIKYRKKLYSKNTYLKSNLKYITFEEYKKICSIISDRYTLREQIIITLMFENGLRIGEILGLTLEDIKFSKNEKYLILRNRTSDRPDQHAKNLTTPYKKTDYFSQDFQTATVGFHIIFLSKETANLFDRYIEEAFSLNSSKYLENLNKFCKADSIEFNNYKNYYLFLSKHHKPLTQSGWNNTLRSIFKSCSIHYDTETKRFNLNHRFRHGFAMMLSQNGTDPLDLQKALRHKNINSVSIYYNPSEFEIAKMQQKIFNLRKYNDDKKI
ncbi:tyrosine-type recombinase/integrase [Streptococcus uberis]|uniref:tyrosine-type recombinase/integrase n=1 Tax=Streptococcus uberis TaxID=1349 RepID=UPI000E068043|nr:site-specific integrase [Streptococcus uberis]SUO88976.1 site-specific tyrosine recombinase XerC [Streptococcus uberis]